jgi:transposase
MERFIGIDVAQAELVVACDQDGLLGRWPNDAAGWEAVIVRLTPLAPTRIVLEGTGGLEVGIAVALTDAGLPAVVINPRWIRAFAQSDGRRAKTDPLDAARIARYGAVLRPELRAQPTAAARDLRALVVRRRQVRDLRIAEQHRTTRAPAIVQASIARSIAALADELATLEAAIAAALVVDPAAEAATRLLQSAPGIGPVIAATLVAELPELGTIANGPIAALAGLAPITHQSGRTTKPATIGGGRTMVRTVLYLAAVTAVRCNPRLKAHYEQLLARHKPRKVALIACARKLLTILNAMLRDGTLWEESPAMA